MCYVLLLFGPGSFLVAHTDDEDLAPDELGASIQASTEIVTDLSQAHGG